MNIHKELSKIGQEISILYVEDEQDTREQYENIFKILYKEVKAVENGKIALEEYTNKQYDLIVTDLTMPGMSGTDMIEEILKIKPDQHIIIMTAHNTSENLRNSIEFQVDGILLKPVAVDKLFQLLYKVSHLIYMEKKSSEEVHGDEKLSTLLEDENQALFLVVINKFNDIVNNFGVEAKKHIIDVVKVHLSNFGVEEDNIFQLHRDVIICSVPKKYLDRILDAVQAFSNHHNSLIVEFDTLKIYITLAYGVILVKQNSNIKNMNEEFLSHINAIVDNIKNDKSGGIIVKMDVDMEEAKRSNALTWLGITLDALRQNTVVPFYQPVVDIKTMKTVSYEVFARIRQEDKYILPEFFIDLSQKAGILEEISQNIFKESFKKLGPTEFPFHINFTDTEWRNSAIKDFIIYLSHQYKIEYNRIILDIMNYELLEPSSKAVDTILKLKELGCKIALKGFASASVNIELLSLLKPDYIKINPILIQKSMSDESMRSALEFLLHYTSSMNIKSILVGVEDEKMLEDGKMVGIDYAQGYFIKEPSDDL